MGKLKRICFILPTLHAGGVENYTLRFLNSVKGKFDVTIVSKNTVKGDLHEKFNETGAKIIYKSIGYFNLRSMLYLYGLFKKSKFDTVCDFTGNFGGLPMYISKAAGINKRITFYRRSTIAFTPTAFRKFYNHFVNRMVYKYSTAILSNSRFAFENFFTDEYKADQRFRIISNGVDAHHFNSVTKTQKQLRIENNLPEEAIIVGHIGRLDPAKNHSFILTTLQKVMSQNPGVVLVLCGKGTDDAGFRQKIDATGFGERIYALGLRSNVEEIYKTFDIFFFPSITEGQPNALIEAMLSGLPVIASRIAPILEALPKEAHIYTVDPYDVDAATDAVTSLLNTQDTSNYIYKEWASEKFDQARNFKLFEDEL